MHSTEAGRKFAEEMCPRKKIWDMIVDHVGTLSCSSSNCKFLEELHKRYLATECNCGDSEGLHQDNPGGIQIAQRHGLNRLREIVENENGIDGIAAAVKLINFGVMNCQTSLELLTDANVPDSPLDMNYGDDMEEVIGRLLCSFAETNETVVDSFQLFKRLLMETTAHDAINSALVDLLIELIAQLKTAGVKLDIDVVGFMKKSADKTKSMSRGVLPHMTDKDIERAIKRLVDTGLPLEMATKMVEKLKETRDILSSTENVPLGTAAPPVGSDQIYEAIKDVVKTVDQKPNS